MTCEEGGEWRLLNPLSVRFSQPRIAPHFRDGHLVKDTASEVFEMPLLDAATAASRPAHSETNAAEGTPPYDIALVPPFPPIRVISWLPKLRRPDGQAKKDANGDQLLGRRAWFSLDNRRLHALQCAAAKRWPRRCCIIVHCIEEVPGTTIKELRKFRTITEGKSVEVGMRTCDTMTFTWSQAVPPGIAAPVGDIDPDGLFSEDLFDAEKWVPQSIMASVQISHEEETESPPTNGYGGNKEMKLAPCPATGWQYKDPAGNIQGPFPLEKMRIWHQYKFFYADLLMRSDPVDAFLPFSQLFPAGEEPFRGRVVRYRQDAR